MSDDGWRYLDRGRPLAMFSDLIHVVCPGCGERAVVVPRPGLPSLKYYSELRFRPRRLACAACGLTRDWTARRRANALVGVWLSGPDEPFFGLPLWLQAPCRGEVLWAYNERHLDMLEAYVTAGLRERTPWPSSQGMLDRLPAWIKASGNRADVLRAIRRLRDTRRRPPGAYGRSTERRDKDLYMRGPY